MSITPFTIYLWQLADKFSTLFIIAGILMLVLAFLIFICCVDYVSSDEDLKDVFGPIKKLVIGAFISLSLSTVIPSSKTVAMMAIVPAIANSKAVQQDAPEMWNLAVEALKQQLKSLQ